MTHHDHGHGHGHGTAPAAPRRILGIRFGKQKPTDPKLENGKVGCCGTCVGAPRPGLPAK